MSKCKIHNKFYQFRDSQSFSINGFENISGDITCMMLTNEGTCTMTVNEFLELKPGEGIKITGEKDCKDFSSYKIEFSESIFINPGETVITGVTLIQKAVLAIQIKEVLCA